MLAASVLASGLISPFAEEVYDTPETHRGAMTGLDRGRPHLVDLGSGWGRMTPGQAGGSASASRRDRRELAFDVVAPTRPAGEESATDDDAEPADPCLPSASVAWSFCPAGPRGRLSWLLFLPHSPLMASFLRLRSDLAASPHLAPSSAPTDRHARPTFLRC